MRCHAITSVALSASLKRLLGPCLNRGVKEGTRDDMRSSLVLRERRVSPGGLFARAMENVTSPVAETIGVYGTPSKMIACMFSGHSSRESRSGSPPLAGSYSCMRTRGFCCERAARISRRQLRELK